MIMVWKISNYNAYFSRFISKSPILSKNKIVNTPHINFSRVDSAKFFRTLNKRVNSYFKENEISRNGNWKLHLKSVVMFSLYLAPYFLLLSLDFPWWAQLLMAVIMGVGMAGVGMNVMHDANHGAYSSKKWINKIMGSSMYILAGNVYNWQVQHNVLHHTYTNIHGHDEDIEQSIMRFSPDQERKPFFKYQMFYAPFLYGLMTIYWALYKDVDQLLRYQKLGLLKSQGLSSRKAWYQMIVGKIVYVLLVVVLPLTLGGLLWWQWLIGFVCMHFLAGLILALIFQPAHVLEETEFYEPTEGSVDNNWAIHQMRTTANFANRSKWFSWLIGGLNFQIEHHLFPHICHVHYREISGIVKETAQKHNIPYNEHKTFGHALKSHFSLLSALGTGEYDQAIA